MEDDNMKTIFALVMIAILALTGCSQVMDGETINVAGQSEFKYKPDQAEVWIGISIVKVTAEDAQSEANIVINDIIDGLRYKGITEDDISTEQLSLYEERRWEGGKSTVVGWRATQTLKVKTTDLSKVGTIVDVAVNNGANRINNINFGLSPALEAEYKKQALAEATKNAREKAETLAESLGVKLGDIKSVSESNYYYRPYAYTMEKAVGMDAVAEAAQILPQDVTVTGNVNIIYKIKQ